MILEYKFLELKIKDRNLLTEELNQLGLNGWDVIYYGEIPPDKFGKEWKITILLKRQKIVE